jgi:hypothetical protein
MDTPRRIQSDTVLRLRNKGFPRFGGKRNDDSGNRDGQDLNAGGRLSVPPVIEDRH